MFLSAIVAIYSCQAGKTELTSTMPIKKEAVKFQELPATLILKEQNIRMTAQRYALSSLPQLDSLVLTEVYIPMPGTDGKFNLLSVKRGEQYNIALTGGGQAFVNAATLLSINFSFGQKNYITQGKTWFKTEKEPSIIIAGEFTIALWPHSKLNVDNYPDDAHIMISLKEGHAIVSRYGQTIPLPPQFEIRLERATGKIETKMIHLDVSSWTVGGCRSWEVDFNYAIRDIGRLYNKDVFFADTSVKKQPLDIGYRTSTIEQVIDEYNSKLASAKLQLSEDSLKVVKR